MKIICVYQAGEKPRISREVLEDILIGFTGGMFLAAFFTILGKVLS